MDAQSSPHNLEGNNTPPHTNGTGTIIASSNESAVFPDFSLQSHRVSQVQARLAAITPASGSSSNIAATTMGRGHAVNTTTTAAVTTGRGPQRPSPPEFSLVSSKENVSNSISPSIWPTAGTSITSPSPIHDVSRSGADHVIAEDANSSVGRGKRELPNYHESATMGSSTQWNSVASGKTGHDSTAIATPGGVGGGGGSSSGGSSGDGVGGSGDRVGTRENSSVVAGSASSSDDDMADTDENVMARLAEFTEMARRTAVHNEELSRELDDERRRAAYISRKLAHCRGTCTELRESLGLAQDTVMKLREHELRWAESTAHEMSLRAETCALKDDHASAVGDVAIYKKRCEALQKENSELAERFASIVEEKRQVERRVRRLLRSDRYHR